VRLSFLSPALREILEAIEYYQSQAPGLGGALDVEHEGPSGHASGPCENGLRFIFAVSWTILRETASDVRNWLCDQAARGRRTNNVRWTPREGG
jgi:hypothetical protein